MNMWKWFGFAKRNSKKANRPRRCSPLRVEHLENRTVPSTLGGVNPNQTVDTTLTPTQLASLLVGVGVDVSNVTFTGGADTTGSFDFTDPNVVGFSQGIMLSSGNATMVVGPNASDTTSTDFGAAGDADLTTLSGFQTYDAAVLEFDFIPTANQVVFTYTFASDEYPEWVDTAYNDVFAFFVNGTNYATVRQIAGDPTAPFVPVAVNNINNSNPVHDPMPTPMRPDLFRMNYYNPGGPSLVDFELDGITSVLTFQAPVNPGVLNHMKLAIADASDGIYDSAVFIQSGSLVSNENPVADLSLQPETGSAPLLVTAIIEGEDPNGLPLTYTIDWGDGTFSNGPLDQPSNDDEKTALVDHTYTVGGEYFVTLTVSNGTLTGTSIEDVDVIGGSSAPVITLHPANQTVVEGNQFTFTAAAIGSPNPTVQWQMSIDGGATFNDISGAVFATYSATAALADNGYVYHAVFTNSEGSATTDSATLTVTPGGTTPPALGVGLTDDTGISDSDLITQEGELTLTGVEIGASVEYSTDGGNSWSDSFSAVEGLNTVDVRQIDVNGNESDATTFSFTLDTTAPVVPGVTLTEDTGKFADDQITKIGTLAVTDIEPGAILEYSTDGGATWSNSFTAIEGSNTVAARQTDVAGNVSDVASFSFTLDTSAPTAPSVELTEDTGSSATDNITNAGSLTLGGLETGAGVQYSIDNGSTWSDSFTAAEGLNTVHVRQVDVAGNFGPETTFAFTLDTVVAAPGVALVQDTGSSATDNITKVGSLTISGQESGAIVDYSTNDGATWSTTFVAVEGANSILVRQTDLAGNVSGVTAFSFVRDTTAPVLHPTFSSIQPFLVNATGITVSANATDAWGIASQTDAAVNTATAGLNSVTCFATDVAGNSASMAVSYVVGYALIDVLPLPGKTLKKKANDIPVSFKLVDANGLISDQTAATLVSNTRVTFNGLTTDKVKYDKRTKTFSAKAKTGKPATGAYVLSVRVTLGGVDVASIDIPINVA